MFFVEYDEFGERIYTWNIRFPKVENEFSYGLGDTLHLALYKPFRSSDVFSFTTELPTVDDEIAEDQLKDVRVVPNPYVVATAHELPLPPAITSGRGERKNRGFLLP